jgi:hypothetical protein
MNCTILLSVAGPCRECREYGCPRHVVDGLADTALAMAIFCDEHCPCCRPRVEHAEGGLGKPVGGQASLW